MPIDNSNLGKHKRNADEKRIKNYGIPLTKVNKIIDLIIDRFLLVKDIRFFLKEDKITSLGRRRTEPTLLPLIDKN